jgi:hypothetical protein
MGIPIYIVLREQCDEMFDLGTWFTIVSHIVTRQPEAGAIHHDKSLNDFLTEGAP